SGHRNERLSRRFSFWILPAFEEGPAQAEGSPFHDVFRPRAHEDRAHPCFARLSQTIRRRSTRKGTMLLDPTVGYAESGKCKNLRARKFVVAKGASWSITSLHRQRETHGQRQQGAEWRVLPRNRLAAKSLLDLTEEALDVRIIGLKLRKAGRVAHRLFLMPQIARKTGGGVKTLAIIDMATEQIAQNLHG